MVGDPCTFGDVNADAGPCIEDLLCLGIPADGSAGTCPGGEAVECSHLMDVWNRDCVDGNCGASFCAEECDEVGYCPVGHEATDIAGMCYCVPFDQCDANGGCPDGFTPHYTGNTCYCMPA